LSEYSIRKIILAFRCVVFRAGWHGCNSRAALLAGAWGYPSAACNDLPPVTRADGSISRPVYTPLPAYKDTSFRQVVRIAGATRMLGLRLTNLFGGKALHIGTVHVAEAGENGAIVACTDHVITFAGQRIGRAGLQARLGVPAHFRTEGSSWPSAFPK
jgi:hypothetical protein